MLNVWFMFDNHTFERIDVSADHSGMVSQIARLFGEDGCGSIFVRDELGGTLKLLTLHGTRGAGGRYGVAESDITNLVDAILLEESFHRAMVA